MFKTLKGNRGPPRDQIRIGEMHFSNNSSVRSVSCTSALHFTWFSGCLKDLNAF